MTNTQNEPAELLPCPFCGTRPHIEDGRNDRPWVVQCYNRDCRVQPFIDDGDTKTHAIAGWNGIRPASSAVVDALPDRSTRLGAYLANEAGSRAMLATLPASVRERLEAWQTHQSEWFSATLLEVVSEFIRFDDATRSAVVDALREADKRHREQPTDPVAQEYFDLWLHAERRADAWRGIASAMGYKPNAHENVKPTAQWLIDRIAKYRAEAALANTPKQSAEVPAQAERVPTSLDPSLEGNDYFQPNALEKDRS